MNARAFTDRDIHLALDGELPEDERAAYQAWLEANPDMKARSLRYAADNAALRNLFAGVLEEPVPSRLEAAVNGDVPKRKEAAQWWRMAAAAALLIAGGLGGYLAGASGIRLRTRRRPHGRAGDRRPPDILPPTRTDRSRSTAATRPI
jgi:anti-sigma factor RsiW